MTERGLLGIFALAIQAAQNNQEAMINFAEGPDHS